ncbi:uncharacterized protein LOC111270580 [Varroa jacobsoni]|uniref:Uncharacterized protein n=1 Tax=Varroa destructor TaxID=109461 RepID=A0A7M7JLP2_VARDE|nr:uncharacterized protein LOC111246657 [Varroa destructor]XP_022652349.1 uncharacterized protein LOC111246657 [Varroa destructor]XP_022652359.1 uncharacterized protein LOC111246657 [Varroa destructor]XP_022706597.1 uncharacterized protein LOC111270580 [Varroa jacobsoni]XP_022706598.1 uncharacterized protein LOC111270580 [Varroa jacobsoni]
MLERTYGDTSPLWVEESAQLLDILIPVLHFTGVLTTIVLWGVSIELIVRHSALGFFLTVCALLTTVFELAFFVDFWLEMHNRSEAWRWWRCVRCLDFLPKAGLYATLAILCFVYQHGGDIWLPILAGVMSIVLAVNYLIVGLLIYARIKREQDYPAFEVDLSFPEPASLIQQEEIILL